MRWVDEHGWARTATACTASVVLCMLLLTLVLRLDRARLEVPFQDGRDVLLHSMLVKSMVDNGWVWRNPFLGAPYGTQLFDFPAYDNLDLAILKLIASFTSNYAVILNLFFLLTFPLIVLSALLVLRSFNISYPSALLASLLFAFLPYHFLRGEKHLFSSAYFVVPPMAMLILWVWQGKPTSEDPLPQCLSLTRRRMMSAIVICLFVGSAFFYYPFFGCCLLCVAGVVSAIRFKCPTRLAWGIGLAILIFAVFIVNMSPTWIYAVRYGRNPEVGVRAPNEVEVLGLKMTHLLLPISGHRIEFLRTMRDKYDRVTPYEGGTASLGTVGDMGFVFLLGWLFCSPQRFPNGELFRGLSVLTLSAVLFGTVGGLGSIFNFLISPEIRSQNRICVYVAFFSFFAMALLLDAARAKMGASKRANYFWYGLVAVILCLGILDQTSPSFAPDYPSLKLNFQIEHDFVAQIEASLPAGAMIFQLPNESFPEAPPIATMQEYDELRGYLHSRSLRWSSGAMKGRPEALWVDYNGLDIVVEQTAAASSGEERKLWLLFQPALDTLAFAGFSGIYIDRHGFHDNGTSITSHLQTAVGRPPLTSEDQRFEFFNLVDFQQALRAKYTPEQWEAKRRKALALPHY
jgi:phosphoglycerol transferase